MASAIMLVTSLSLSAQDPAKKEAKEGEKKEHKDHKEGEKKEHKDGEHKGAHKEKKEETKADKPK